MTFYNGVRPTRSLRFPLLCLIAIGLLFASSEVVSPKVFAQDVPTLEKTIETNDNAFAIGYPADYVTLTAANLVSIGTSKAAIAAVFQSEPALTSGNVVIQVRYFSADNQPSSGLDTSNPNALLKSAIKGATPQQMSSITTFKSGNVEGSRVTLPEKTLTRVVETFMVNKTPFLVTLLTAPKESGVYEGTLDAIVQSIREKPPVALGQTFSSRNQIISLDYPDNWVTQETADDMHAYRVLIASSDAALSAYVEKDKPVLTSGQIVIELYYFPPHAKDFYGYDTTTPENLINYVVKEKQEMAGTVQSTNLGAYAAAKVDLNNTNLSATYMTIIGDQAAVLAGIYTAPREAGKVQTILEAVIVSVRRKANPQLANPATAVPTQSSSSAFTASNVVLDKTFTSSDQSLNVRYPSGWLVESSDPMVVFFGNSKKALAELNSPSTPEIMSHGNIGVEMNYSPVDTIPSNIDTSGDPAKFLKSALSDVAPFLGKMESHTIGSYETAQVRLDVMGLENSFYSFYIGRNVVTVVGSTATGELAQYQPILEAMIASVTLNLPAKK